MQENKSDNKNIDNEVAELEAVLFMNSSPISIKKLAGFFSVSKKNIELRLDGLEKKLNSVSSGLNLIKNEDSILLGTKPSLSKLLDKFVKDGFKEDLSRSAMETLSIIVYFSPIPRARIDYIRGVNSTYMLRALLVRGLIKRIEKEKIYLYEPSIDLLKYVGINGKENLPNFYEYNKKMLELFNKEDMLSSEDTKQNNINIKNNI